MEILNSDWLINMLKKSSKTPQGRLLALFDVLGDWLNAPDITEKFRADVAQKTTQQAISSGLEHYLTQQAALAGAAEPAMLAHQLYFMLLAAIQEALRVHHVNGFAHAKSAAQALITAQTNQEFYIKKSSAYIMVASFLGTSILVGGLWVANDHHLIHLNLARITDTTKTKNMKDASYSTEQAIITQPNTSSLIASPEQTAALFATLEQIRKGNCQFPEALQMPDSYKSIYIENIIGGNVSSKVADQKIIMQILQKVRCNYTPMLMENSKN